MYPTNPNYANLFEAVASINRGIGALRYLGAPRSTLDDLTAAADRLDSVMRNTPIDAMDDEPPALQHDGPTPLAVLALEAAALPALRGGAPSYEPSEADEACLEYEAWLDALEAGRDWDHEADAIHRDLYGY